jgi:hypothetical protein
VDGAEPDDPRPAGDLAGPTGRVPEEAPDREPGDRKPPKDASVTAGDRPETVDDDQTPQSDADGPADDVRDRQQRLGRQVERAPERAEEGTQEDVARRSTEVEQPVLVDRPPRDPPGGSVTRAGVVLHRNHGSAHPDAVGARQRCLAGTASGVDPPRVPPDAEEPSRRVPRVSSVPLRLLTLRAI